MLVPFLLSALCHTLAVGAIPLHAKLGLEANASVFTSYVTDWAHYRAPPYKWSPSDYSGIAKRTDVALYSFIYFCPPAGTSPMPYWASAPYGSCGDYNEFELMSVDPIDSSGMRTIAAMGTKVVMSVGGWNFPSAYFSKMTASAASRAKFVSSVKSWMSQHGAAGVDLDWEFPCSPPRTNPVKISCSKFHNVADAGGDCPADTDNLLLLVKDLRKGLGDDAIISIASQAGRAHADQMDLKAVSPYLDMWHVMTYDYSVSDITAMGVTSPNAPLYNPHAGAQMSINQTISHYLASGVPASKIMVGLPLYAHTWFVPGLTTAASWQKFGLTPTNQGECCGPFKATFGAKPGKGSQLCGSMMYSEVLAAKPQTYYDEQTQSVIGYFNGTGDDQYTEAGTWLTYNNERSSKAVVEWALKAGLAGVFVYSADMDTKDYQFMNNIADALGKPKPAPAPPPSPTPTPPGPPSPPSPSGCAAVWGPCGTAGRPSCCLGACTCVGSSTYKQCIPAKGKWQC